MTANWKARDKQGLTLLERAVALSGNGLSAKQIALALGSGLTRNAVVGKLDRYRRQIAGIDDSKNSDAYERKPCKAYRPSMPRITKSNVVMLPNRPKERLVTPIDAPLPKAGKRATTLLVKRNGKLYANDDLNRHSCRWPIGDPLSPDFHFCGKATVPLKPYCPECCKKAFRSVAEAMAEARAVKKTPVFEPT